MSAGEAGHLLPLSLFAQVPQKVNYQSIARSAGGQPLFNTTITILLTVRSGSATGPVVYSETHTQMTNQFGLFNVQMKP